MRWFRVAGAALAVAALALSVVPAGATTLIREGLEKLTADDEGVLLGRVLDIHSYWNADHSFILTDVRVSAERVLKGDPKQAEVTFTIMGGTVGDLSTLVIGGPDLVPGSDYVLFLHHEDLPGALHRLTVGSLMQGVFDVTDTPHGRRAVSQAARHPLLSDASGATEPPGGADGLSLDEMITQVGRLAGDH